MGDRYKIIPGVFIAFKLLRWVGWPILGWWQVESYSDDYDDLADRVRKCGGRLVAPPLPSKENQE